MLVKLATLSEKAIEDHHLNGLIYSKTKRELYKKAWRQQLFKNQMIHGELIALGQDLKGKEIQVTLLKGFALLGDIYPDWGQRFASDVDCLIDPGHLSELEKLLSQRGFQKLESKKWQGNDFKSLFSKKTELLEITLEVHTRLFWHVKDLALQTRQCQTIMGFQSLDLESQLLHLCGHLAFQHTFIKLFWLFDIQFFIEKYRDQFNWPKFWQQATEHKLLKSCDLCLSLVDENLCHPSTHDRFSQKLLSSLCNEAFLISPRSHGFRYLMIKILLKEPLSLNFTYFSRLFRHTIVHRF